MSAHVASAVITYVNCRRHDRESSRIEFRTATCLCRTHTCARVNFFRFSSGLFNDPKMRRTCVIFRNLGATRPACRFARARACAVNFHECSQPVAGEDSIGNFFYLCRWLNVDCTRDGSTRRWIVVCGERVCALSTSFTIKFREKRENVKSSLNNHSSNIWSVCEWNSIIETKSKKRESSLTDFLCNAAVRVGKLFLKTSI